MKPAALDDLEDVLERMTGVGWQVIASHTIGRGSYREAYAFLWRSDRVAYDSGAVVYLDRGDIFSREPFSAKFIERDSGDEFVAANVHIIYGKDKGQRIPELRALDEYWGFLESTYASEPDTFLFGDFNMVPTEPAFMELKRFAAPAIVKGKSTLGRRDGTFANLYDNIWIDLDSGTLRTVRAGIYNFPAAHRMSHEEARATVSDHAPAFAVVELGTKPLAERHGRAMGVFARD